MQDTLQLSQVETEMMEEVFQVFSKYADKTRTFGVNLVHSHFSVDSNEILYETHDSISRVLTIKPVKIKEFNKEPLATAWQRTQKGEIAVSMLCCDNPGGGGPGPSGPPRKEE